MKVKDELLNIFDKYEFDYKRVHMDWDWQSIATEVSSLLIQENINSENPRLMMAEIWTLIKTVEIKDIFYDPDFQASLSEILLNDNNFKVEGNYIKYDNFLPCEVVQTSKEIRILNDSQIEVIHKMGYGIKNFKIEIGWFIKDVFCEGKHPNLNENSGCFCLDPTIFDSELNLKNLLMIKEMLSQFNLRSYFISKEEYDIIMEVIS